MIAYGIDIGVYRHSAQSRVNGHTTFAWARTGDDVTLTYINEHSRFCFCGNPKTGSDIRELGGLISKDLAAGSKIAIGMEAPMWQPTPMHLPDGAFQLFAGRFAEEKEFGWYKQSGAAATVKAISIGVLLFSLVEFPDRAISFGVNPEADQDVTLFEGFVAGSWKLPGKPTVPLSSHCWDAITTAVAFRYQAPWSVTNSAPSSYIHGSGTAKTEVVSHWKTILERSGRDVGNCDADCMVLGFDTLDQRLKKYCSGTGSTT